MNESAEQLSPIDKIAAALAQAQGQLTNPEKTKTVNAGKYKYRYADLADVIDHVRPVLAANDLAAVQMVRASETGNTLVTRLVHKSGQFLESTYPLPRQAAAQEMGSAITYARRYSLCAILGIAAEDDDDGKKAGAAPAEETQRDELIERMGAASLGNRAVMEYARGAGLHEGAENTVEALSLETIATLLGSWEEAATAMKEPPPKKSPAKKAATTPETKQPPEEKPKEEVDELAGISEPLADLMRKDGITPDMLHAYYVGEGHLPDTVKPAKLPATYIKAITSPANWAKATTKMKEKS